MKSLKRAYSSIAKSDLLVHQGRANAAKAGRQTILHRAILQDKYVGTVVALFAFPQA